MRAANQTKTKQQRRRRHCTVCDKESIAVTYSAQPARVIWLCGSCGRLAISGIDDDSRLIDANDAEIRELMDTPQVGDFLRWSLRTIRLTRWDCPAKLRLAPLPQPVGRFPWGLVWVGVFQLAAALLASAVVLVCFDYVAKMKIRYDGPEVFIKETKPWSDFEPGELFTPLSRPGIVYIAVEFGALGIMNRCPEGIAPAVMPEKELDENEAFQRCVPIPGTVTMIFGEKTHE